MKAKFIPIIVGTDMNAYNMAISFHEAYGMKPVLLGQSPMSFTEYSTITTHIIYDENLHETDVFLKHLEKISQQYKNEAEHLVLVATNDEYVRLIVENRQQLEKDFKFNYIEENLLNDLLVKNNFYKVCERHGIDIPKTYMFDCASEETFTEEMTYPIIIKPGNGVNYFKHSFPGQHKVYKLNSLEEAQEVIEKIKDSGYRDELIIQDYIPGDDTYMWDAVVYMSQESEPQVVSFGQVVLQEHTITGIGNYTAVITKPNREMMDKLVQFLKELGYVGFANFDLKYDQRDGKFKVFEVNVRQGRSSYYITQCGHNMAQLLVDDLIENKSKSLEYIEDHFLFTVVPKQVLKTFVKNDAVKKEVKQLLKKKQFGNPLFYKKDKSLKRKLYLFLRQINYYRKYKNSHW